MINTIIAFSFLALGVGIFKASNKGWLTDTFLERLDKIASILSFLFALVIFVWQPIQPEFEYGIEVYSDKFEPIENAIVIVEVRGGFTFEGITDQDGIAYVILPEKYKQRDVTLFIDAEGFKLYSGRFLLTSRELNKQILLTKNNNPVTNAIIENELDELFLPSELEVIRDELRPLDVILLMDTSCSLYPDNELGCEKTTQHGSDIDGVRFKGASILFNRLGISHPIEEEFRAGVISFGANTRILSPLISLSENRTDLINATKSATPERATKIVPALHITYDVLKTSPNRPSNAKAIILVTDGFPWPTEGQSESIIADLISSNQDVKHYVILLEEPSDVSSSGYNYSTMWDTLAESYEHVSVYHIESASQFVDIFHDVVSRLEQTAPSQRTYELEPNIEHPIFISRYVEAVTFTIIHENADTPGNITILDPDGEEISITDQGVQWIPGDGSEVEIISIASPRLHTQLKDLNWTVVSETPVEILTDAKGSYNILFLEPEHSYTTVLNSYEVIGRYDPQQSFIIKFQLVDAEGNTISEPQPIMGTIQTANGVQTNLNIPANIEPDSEGVYEFQVNFARSSYHVPFTPNKVTLEISTFTDNTDKVLIPITTAWLDVNLHGRTIPFTALIRFETQEFYLEINDFLVSNSTEILVTLSFSLFCGGPFLLILLIRKIQKKKKSKLLDESENDQNVHLHIEQETNNKDEVVTISGYQENPEGESRMIDILFLASSPIDEVRLRLDREVRDIRERLRLAENRDSFRLNTREAIRPRDLTQAIFDVKPYVLHFSGHGQKSGELCLENNDGFAHPVEPKTLADLFSLYKNEINCVILNACFSEIQAEAIAKHISYVIGMNNSISDAAAITFSVGFYKALAANRTVPDAFQFGIVELGLEGFDESNTPQLIQKEAYR